MTIVWVRMDFIYWVWKRPWRSKALWGVLGRNGMNTNAVFGETQDDDWTGRDEPMRSKKGCHGHPVDATLSIRVC
ncbi:hypothetical protein G6F48_007760 [Rhizopus delemar]|nr:hypothetical protein G6F48_007760 [Rhizopus delemar]